MFFILSKILAFILAPVTWILLLLLISFIVKKATVKKKLRIAAVVILIIFSNPYLFKKTVLWWQAKPVTFNKMQHFSAGILLGGMAAFDKNDVGYFGENADRFIQTEKLYHQKFIDKIIVSGGSGSLFRQNLKEADFIKAELIKSGVAEQNILIENTSRNTYENAMNTKRIIDSLQLKGPFVLITSAFHIPRSLKVFNKAGINTVPFPSDFIEIDTPFAVDSDLLPRLGLLNFWKIIIKEIIGTKIYELTGKA
jgi:uncharacterized SAM-binding protein YcdF (DUF218 family)